MDEKIVDSSTKYRNKHSHLTELNLSVKQLLLNHDRTSLSTRLQAVTVSKINPELASAWRNRIIIRSRLRKYTSDY